MVSSLQVYYHSPTDVLSERDVNVDDPRAILTELAEFRRYVVRVVAYNANGPGPATDELTCRTLSDGNTSLFTGGSRHLRCYYYYYYFF